MTITAKNKKISDLKFVYSENNTLSIIFQNNEILLGVVGEFNSNIKELERITKTSIYSRGNSILIKSDPEKNEIVKNAIQFLTPVIFDGYNENIGKVVKIRIENSNQNTLFGKVEKNMKAA